MVEAWSLKLEAWSLKLEIWSLRLSAWSLKLDIWCLRPEARSSRQQAWTLVYHCFDIDIKVVTNTNNEAESLKLASLKPEAWDLKLDVEVAAWSLKPEFESLKLEPVYYLSNVHINTITKTCN